MTTNRPRQPLENKSFVHYEVPDWVDDKILNEGDKNVEDSKWNEAEGADLTEFQHKLIKVIELDLELIEVRLSELPDNEYKATALAKLADADEAIAEAIVHMRD